MSPNAQTNEGRFSPPAAVRTNRWNRFSASAFLVKANVEGDDDGEAA